jgi:hypothetical protein
MKNPKTGQKTQIFKKCGCVFLFSLFFFFRGCGKPCCIRLPEDELRENQDELRENQDELRENQDELRENQDELRENQE